MRPYRGMTKGGKWVYGSYIKFAKAHAIGFADEEYGNWNEYDVLPETVGQSTGLLDKNGKEIYEGDIIDRYVSVRGRQAHKIVEVYQGKYGGWQPFSNDTWCDPDKSCIIGNIHENPELLEQE